MIIVTTDSVPGFAVAESFGLVRGNTIRARFIGKDLMAVFRHIAGGEIKEYVKMMAEAREQAIDRMVEEAESLGANAVIGVHFQTAMVMQGAAEIMAYGTAVQLRPEDAAD